MKIRAISLFCGAGGMDCGFIRAGVKIVWANDFNKMACETYKANFGDHVHWGSIMDFDYSKLPDCDLVIGGPPCQGFSVAGKMDPNDPRSRLVFEYQKVVAAKRPRYFVMENVAALARLEKFSQVRASLLDRYTELGYHVQFKILNSCDYETPQRRERMIMIGTTDPMENIQFPRKCRKQISAREILLRMDDAGTGNNQGVCKAKITVTKNPVLRKSPYAGMLFNGLGRPIDLNRPCQTLPASMGGNKTPIIDVHLLRNPDGEDWLKKLHEFLKSGVEFDPYKIEVPNYFRRLTVSEASRLQGFPEDFVFHGSQCEKFKQIGNSVPPPFAFHIAKAVISSFKGNIQHQPGQLLLNI